MKIILIILASLILASIGLFENSKVYGIMFCEIVYPEKTSVCTEITDEEYEKIDQIEVVIEPNIQPEIEPEIIKVIVEPEKPDPIPSHGIGRNHNLFAKMCEGQELIAMQYFNSSEIQNQIPPSFTIYFNIISRAEDPILQANILKEKQRSEKMYFNLFGNYTGWFD